MPDLPRGAARDHRPGVHAEPLRLHRLPHVDVGVARRRARGRRTAAPAAPPRRPATPWCPAPGGRRARPSGGRGPGAKSRTAAGEVVDAVEHLDDDALDPQVGAPDLLDELGVVLALDEDPRRRSRPSPAGRSRPATRSPCGRMPRAPRRARRPPSRAARSGSPASRRRGSPARAGSPWCARGGPRGAPRARRRPSRRARRRPPSRSRRPRRPVPGSAASSTERPRAGRRQSPPSTSPPYLSVTAARLRDIPRGPARSPAFARVGPSP